MLDILFSTSRFSAESLYCLSLAVGAVVNWVLAGLLVFDPNNYLYTETRRYLRSRNLTALSLFIFGCGFALHWLFLPRFSNPVAASALSLAYFHFGGTLFSMSHTSLLDRHYLRTSVVVRDTLVLVLSLVVYSVSALTRSHLLLHVGFALFFLHIGFLTVKFYRSFHRIYAQLGSYAEYFPNYTDHDMRWLFYSCHLIILFGIGSVVITLLFPDDTLPFTILMMMGVVIFSYIYKSLDNYSVFATEAEQNLLDSEKYLNTEDGKYRMRIFLRKRKLNSYLTTYPLLSGFFKQW